MCLIAFAYRAHPRYPLVVVSNRDEFYDRPTRPADFWPDQPDILAGRDLLAGGTWFGVNRAGHWAAVTNFREGRLAQPPRSRGELPTGFLGGNAAPAVYARKVVDMGHEFSGFSLLAGTADELVYCSNLKDEVRRLAPGIYTLSNDFLDTPWPKAEHARDGLSRVLDSADLTTETLLAVLGARAQFPDHRLPQTGVGIEMERTLSPAFIVGDTYGTRCTTVLTVDQNGHARFAEQNFVRGRRDGELREFGFAVGAGIG